MPHHVHLAYASRYGQTRKIVERFAAAASKLGHTVSEHDAALGPGELPPDATFVVVAGAVYSNQHDDAVARYLQAHREAIAARDNGLISVSLAAALGTDAGEDSCIDYVDELQRLHRWEPKRVATLPGALNESAYDPATKALLRVASWRAGLPASGDVEFTQWPAVDALARRWLGRA
jgi:menaquinone-dependent protoporphyrinogen IX oxidase